MEGWIAVTISGLVTVSLLKPNGQVLTATESLCRLRCRVALADVAFTGGGNIVVATSDGSSTSPVQFYKVCVSVVNEKCKIDTEILPSLFMRCTTDPARKDKYPAITHLKFLARDMSEQVGSCSLLHLGQSGGDQHFLQYPWHSYLCFWGELGTSPSPPTDLILCFFPA